MSACALFKYMKRRRKAMARCDLCKKEIHEYSDLRDPKVTILDDGCQWTADFTL